MRVLVTGAWGLIGRYTVAALLRDNHAVRTFQRHAFGARTELANTPCTSPWTSLERYIAWLRTSA